MNKFFKVNHVFGDNWDQARWTWETKPLNLLSLVELTKWLHSLFFAITMPPERSD